MQEITQWLRIKYPEGCHPRQMTKLDNALQCADDVRFNTIARPDDWQLYPPMTGYYDQDIMAFYTQGSSFPLRVSDYRKKYAFTEQGSYPEEDYSGILSAEPEAQGCRVVSRGALRSVPFLADGHIIYRDIAAGENHISFRQSATSASPR